MKSENKKLIKTVAVSVLVSVVSGVIIKLIFDGLNKKEA